MTTPVEITLRVIQALESLSAPYMLVGSLSLAAHGEARATRDSDLVADLKREDISRLAEALGDDFYLDEQDAADAIVRRRSFGIICMSEAFKVDVFAVGTGAFDREAFGRRQPLTLEDESSPVFIQTAEDSVIAKLRWFRLGGEVSDQQWRDVLGVLKLQGARLDREYLRKWAAHERLTGLLERAERDAA